MVPCLHQGNIYMKRKLRVWRDQKCIPLVGAKTPIICAVRGKLPRLKVVSIGPRKETCVNWGGPIAMVLCLHQGNIYIKRKLREWRDQKCIPLVSAKTPLTCVVRQTTPSQGSRYKAENGNLRKSGWTYRDGTVFAPRQYLYQKVARGMERPEMYSPSRCKNPSYLCRPSNYPVSGDRAENENLRKFGSNYRHGTVFAPKQCLYHKEGTGMESKKCIPLVGAKTLLTCTGLQTTPIRGGQ